MYVGKARSLRKRLASYWGKPLHPRTQAMMEAAAERRVDARLRRGRRADARVQPDPAPPAAVQHPLPGRQVLSVPGADRGGDLAARAGHAGREAQERPVLRPVRPRLGDPRHPRRAHPGLPGPHLLERVLRPAGPGPAARACTTTSAGAPGPACPRSPASPRSRTAPTSTRWRLPGRQHKPVVAPAGRRRCGRRPSARSTSRPPSCATSSRPRAGRWRRRRWCSPSPRTST